MADYAIHDTTLIGTSNIIRKKEGSSALIDPADYPKRINLMGMLEEKTASSASICSFSDGADDVPMKSVIAHIAPTLTGTNAVNMVQTGKNLIPDTNYKSSNFSVADDGTVSQITTGASFAWAYDNSIFKTTLPAGTYTAIEELLTDSTNASHGVQVFNSAGNMIGRVSQGVKTAGTYSATFTLTEATNIGIVCKLYDGTAKLYIVRGSSASSYEPYQENTYTANLGRTVYGADVDLVSGQGSETGIRIDLSELTWNMDNDTRFRSRQTDYTGASGWSGNWQNTISNHFVCENPATAFANRSDYSFANIPQNYYNFDIKVPTGIFADATEFKEWLANVDGNGTHAIIVIDRLDSVPFTFDGQEISSLLGVNNLWHDAGETEAVYRSSGTVTPVPVVPTLITKSITENGTYYAEDDDADGYSSVTVNVQGGETPFVPLFTETKIADNSSHSSSFTLSEDYGNYDMVKIVWYESASSSGFLYTTPDILDEIFSVGVGKLCINKPSTNYYACYTKSGLTWTRSNQRVIDVHEIYGVTFTNCTMTATDLYKRGASTTTKIAITSQTSLKDYDLFMMASIHATDGSETMPSTWLYQYPPENMSEAFSCPVPAVLQEYDANDEAFVISEYGMTSARFFMVQGIKFTPTPSLLSMSLAPTPSEPDSEDPEEEVEEEET